MPLESPDWERLLNVDQCFEFSTTVDYIIIIYINSTTGIDFMVSIYGLYNSIQSTISFYKILVKTQTLYDIPKYIYIILEFVFIFIYWYNSWHSYVFLINKHDYLLFYKF